MPAPIKDYRGHKIGKLTITRIHEERGSYGQVQWYAVCECGGETVVGINEIKKRKSCGCLLQQHPNYIRQDPFLSIFKHHVMSNRNTARFPSNNLTFEEYRVIAQSNCCYCGSPPSNVYRDGTIYQGTDRVDNGIGYDTGNCVPCCATCNYMKREMSSTFFLAQVRKIIEYQDE